MLRPCPDVLLRLSPRNAIDLAVEPVLADLLPHGALSDTSDIATLTVPVARDRPRFVVTAHQALLTGFAMKQVGQTFSSGRIAVARDGVDPLVTGFGCGTAYAECPASGGRRMALEIRDSDFDRRAADPDPVNRPRSLVPDDLRDHMRGTADREGNGFVTDHSVLA